MSERRAQDIAAFKEAVSDEQQSVWISVQAVTYIAQDLKTGGLGRSRLRQGVEQVLHDRAFQWDVLLAAQAQVIHTLQAAIESNASDATPLPSRSQRRLSTTHATLFGLPQNSKLNQRVALQTTSSHDIPMTCLGRCERGSHA